MADGPPHWNRILSLLLVAAPPLGIALLVQRYSVDVPVWDQWNAIVPLFEKMDAGTLGLSDFFALHNEHRMFFPRLISFGLALLTGWNSHAEHFLIWLMACACSFNFWRLARATGWGGRASGGWLFAAQSALLFTPLQFENWLNGIQIVVWLPVICLTASAWIALVPSVPVRFIATAVLATISTFSIASGFLCWVLILPLLLLGPHRVAGRRERVWTAAWLAAFALNLALYLDGYRRPAHHPSPLEFADRPLDALHFLCAFLGSDFAFGTALPPLAVATVVGGLLLVLLCGCVACLWRWRRDRSLLVRALPWLVPPGFAVGNAALTVLGRLGYGFLDNALSSRYVVFSILLPIGLVYLVPTLFRHHREHAPQHRDALFATALTAATTTFALLHLLSSLASLPKWDENYRFVRITKGLVELIDVVDEPEQLATYVHPDVAPLRSRALLLDRLGFLRPGLVRSTSIGTIADARDPGSKEYGAVERSGVTGSGTWGAVGWAVLPYAQRPADAVLLSYELRAGEPVLFALAGVGRRREDVAGAKNDAAYLGSGWVGKLDAKRIPDQAVTVKAWAFDADRGRAYRLAGEAPRP